MRTLDPNHYNKDHDHGGEGHFNLRGHFRNFVIATLQHFLIESYFVFESFVTLFVYFVLMFVYCVQLVLPSGEQRLIQGPMEEVVDLIEVATYVIKSYMYDFLEKNMLPERNSPNIITVTGAWIKYGPSLEKPLLGRCYHAFLPFYLEQRLRDI